MHSGLGHTHYRCRVRTKAGNSVAQAGAYRDARLAPVGRRRSPACLLSRRNPVAIGVAHMGDSGRAARHRTLVVTVGRVPTLVSSQHPSLKAQTPHLAPRRARPCAAPTSPFKSCPTLATDSVLGRGSAGQYAERGDASRCRVGARVIIPVVSPRRGVRLGTERLLGPAALGDTGQATYSVPGTRRLLARARR
jgi:hypothetical protein